MKQQIGEKLNEDADYEYSGATPGENGGFAERSASWSHLPP